MSVLLQRIVQKYQTVTLINVYTDGPSSQFKQRYLFSNLSAWESEFSIKIIWNFFATSHGKGAVDGIGGTVKRSVWRNVRITAVAPVDAESYAKLANELIENVTILYISAEAITENVPPDWQFGKRQWLYLIQ